jgi:branched-chain amino acid transport system substrate-binding protein
VGGDMSKKDAFREALRKADFDSVRGNFKFGPNHHPIQDIYIRKVVEENGVLTNRIVTKAFANHSDAYMGQCKMK